MDDTQQGEEFLKQCSADARNVFCEPGPSHALPMSRKTELVALPNVSPALGCVNLCWLRSFAFGMEELGVGNNEQLVGSW